MIICMSDIICVTNRKLCRGDFASRIEAVARAKPRAVLLREKDLDKAAYMELAKDVMRICENHGVLCILHSYADLAARLGAGAVHLPMPLLRGMGEKEKAAFRHIGASCHSLEDAMEAERIGCTYLIAGHIFATDCKKGVPPRGLGFLSGICRKVRIPVYAIGGIHPDNFALAVDAGAKGGCVMSGIMRCEDAAEYINAF